MPETLYTADECRMLDRTAIEQCGILGITLMSRAGRVCFDTLLEQWQTPAMVHVFCGTGNNGGDGYVVAALAKKQCIPVLVYQLGDVENLRGDAKLAYENALAEGVPMQAFAADLELDEGVIVDALLGTGLAGSPRDDYQQAILTMNASLLPILAVDIPSGLCSDTGAVPGVATKADITATFIGLKRGMFTGEAADYTGAIVFNDLQIPPEVYEAVPSACWRGEFEWAFSHLPERAMTAHKGSVGTVLVIGGDRGLGGAGILAAQAAARGGAGLIRLATRAEHVGACLARCPEIMVNSVSGMVDLEAMQAHASVQVIGPGLGCSPWSEQLFLQAMSYPCVQVIDADGLNLLAASSIGSEQASPVCVLTPHPGEAARLLGVSTAQVQADRFGAAKQLAEKYSAVVVLKGAGTIVTDGDVILVCDVGGPGMASGGMGDVLSGVIAAMLAQGMTPLAGAVLAVMLHGMAAEHAAQEGATGMLASDLLPYIRTLLT